jgi:hypothetical protein
VHGTFYLFTSVDYLNPGLLAHIQLFVGLLDLAQGAGLEVVANLARLTP